MPPKIRSAQNPETTEEIDKKLSSRVDKLEEYLQIGLRELKNQISTADSADDKGTLLSHIDSFEAKVQDSINAIKSEIKVLQQQSCKNEREIAYIKEDRLLNILLLSGVPEREKEDLHEEVCRIIKTKLKISLVPSDINYCFRLGKKRSSDKKPRPAAIVFINRWKRDIVYRSKKNLKGSEYVISEMLSVEKRNLFTKVRAVVGAKNSWTMRGNIYAFINNAKKLISNEDDLRDVSV